jgi:hypothetical protein
MSEEVLSRLVAKYRELADACYRVSVTVHDRYGRFQKGHQARRPHPALLKKVDLDRALARLYARFFEAPEGSSISTSNSRRQGSDTPASSSGADPAEPSRSE